MNTVSTQWNTAFFNPPPGPIARTYRGKHIRLQIVDFVRANPRCSAGQIAAGVQRAQPGVLVHLKQLHASRHLKFSRQVLQSGGAVHLWEVV